MKILFLHGWQSVPGSVKPTYLAQNGHQVINPKLPDDEFEEAVRVAQAEFDQKRPDVVVGSSRGGAVAMNIKCGETPLVLLCPAWMRWGTATTVKKNTVVLHSRADDVVPFADSEELVKTSGLPASALIEVGKDHRLADQESLTAMLQAVRCLMKPASFSGVFPYAYHVLPLHAAKPIAASRRLLSKVDLRDVGVGMGRSSTAEVDHALGLARFIHFYLPKSREMNFGTLSILNTQLKASAVSPFPHIVMVIQSSELADWQCGVCNFNAAVSRPAWGSVRGGNHARGMRPQDILNHWRGFKSEPLTPKRLRYSYWHDGIAVPLLIGSQITRDPSKVGFNASAAELLLPSPFEIPQSAEFYAFSHSDLESVRIIDHGLAIHLHASNPFPWYAEQDRVATEVRTAINEYFASDDGPYPNLDFDQLRPSA